MLAHTLLPLPDQYVIVDRQRASANGFLVDPTGPANYRRPAAPAAELTCACPKSARASWKSLAQYRNVSPAQFGIDRNVTPGTTFPLYTLFAVGRSPTPRVGGSIVKTTTVGGQSIGIAFTQPVVTYTPPASTSATTTTPTTRPRRRQLDHGDRDRDDHGSTGTTATTTAGDDRRGCDHDGRSTTGATTTAGTASTALDHGNRHGLVELPHPVSDPRASCSSWPRPRIRPACDRQLDGAATGSTPSSLAPAGSLTPVRRHGTDREQFDHAFDSGATPAAIANSTRLDRDCGSDRDGPPRHDRDRGADHDRGSTARPRRQRQRSLDRPAHRRRRSARGGRGATKQAAAQKPRRLPRPRRQQEEGLLVTAR